MIKSLYARFVLWLIAPALEEQRRRDAARPPLPVSLPANVSVPRCSISAAGIVALDSGGTFYAEPAHGAEVRRRSGGITKPRLVGH